MRSPRTFTLAVGLAPLLIAASGCVGDAPQVLPDAGVPDVSAPQDSGGGVDASPDAPAPPSDVVVTVVDEFGSPVAGASVQIGALNAITGPQGKAQLMAPSTYDMAVAFDSIASVTTKRVVGFSGLTSRTPTVEAPQLRARKTDFTITVVGGTYAGGDVVKVLYGPTTASSELNFNVNQTPFPYSGAGWSGEAPNKGSAYAYLVNVVSGLPSQWKSQASPQAYTLADNGAVAPMFTLSPGVATANVGGDVDRSGHAVSNIFLFVTPVGSRGKLVFGSTNFAAGTFSGPVPSASTVGVAVGGIVSGTSVYAWRANIAPGTPNVQVKLPAKLTTQTAPAVNATGVGVGSALSWDGTFPMNVVRVFCGVQQPRTYMVEWITSGTSFTLPDLSGLGAPLPSNASCVWQVTSFAGAATADDTVKPVGWQTFISESGFQQDGARVTTGRPFTSK